MKSKVYFISVKESDSREVIRSKFIKLLDQSTILDCVSQDEKVAIKLHFGEEGNTGFVSPVYVKEVVQRINTRKAEAFITDTNTLYRGRRAVTEEHLEIAREHGFSEEATGAKIKIADGENLDILINQKFIKVAHIAPFFKEVDTIIDVAHFKGHIMTGFGGALKNIGMGCASREGKLSQHSDVSPIIMVDACIGCGNCVNVCPVNAISLKNDVACIDGDKCIGCASCIAVCPNHAIDVNWESGGDCLQEKMIEYASAVLQKLKKKFAFINFALKITKECDCLAKDDPRIAPDVGILASSDPVSVDKASLDLVAKACGKDIFKEVHPERNGMKQLNYAKELGLGSLEYELVEIK